MLVGSPCVNGKEVRATVRSSSSAAFDIFHVFPNPRKAPAILREPEPNADPFLIASLLPAMALGGTLSSASPVSPKLLGAIPQIEDIMLAWDRHLWRVKYPARPRLARVRVEAESRSSEGAPAATGRSASFFTAGVDSFYTAIKHLDEIDALVYVRGFDVRLSDPESRKRIMRGIRKAAEGLHKPLIELRSNLRPFGLRSALDWGAYHGAALASAAAVAADTFGRFYIPSTTTYDHLVPLGSHPILDPLWSTEKIDIVHDGCEASRVEKLAMIADHEVARSWLRVCFENPGGTYNCGSCEKCLRTMTQLRALGRLEEFRSFPPLDLEQMDFAFAPRASDWTSAWAKTLRLLEERGVDPDLQAAIQRVLSTRSKWPTYHAGPALGGSTGVVEQ
jgi:hypothetical protein